MRRKTQKKVKRRSIGLVSIDTGVFPFDYREATAEFHRRLIKKVLSKEDGNVSKAAEKLGITRRALQLQSVKLDIDVEAIRQGYR